MDINISRIIATIINVGLLIVIISAIVKFFQSTTRISKSNSNIEKKLDRLIELLEKKEKGK